MPFSIRTSLVSAAPAGAASTAPTSRAKSQVCLRLHSMEGDARIVAPGVWQGQCASAFTAYPARCYTRTGMNRRQFVSTAAAAPLGALAAQQTTPTQAAPDLVDF